MTTLRGHTLPNVPPLPERRSGADRYDRVSRNVLSIVVVCLALGTAVATAILDSPLPMLLLLVAALGLALLGRPEIATPIFAFVFYLNLPTLATRFHGVPTLVAVLFGLILVLPALKYILIERRPIIFPVPYGLMFAYLAAALTSTLLSADVESSALSLSVFLSEGLLLYFLVVNVVRSTETLRQVIWALLLAGAVMGAISVWQETTHSYHNVLGGLAQINQVGFGVGTDISGKVVRPRLAGPIGEQNRYAQVLVVLVPLALFRFWGERRLLLRAAAGVCTLLIISGILLTFSRGAAVALAGLFLTMAALRYIRIRDLVVVGLAITILIAVVAPQAIIRLDSLAGVAALLSSDESNADGAIVGRATSNLAALNAFLDHPVVGVGPGQYFRRFSQEYGNDLGLRHFDSQRRAHNLYFETAADLGIVGLSAFLAVIGATLLPLWRLRRRLRATRPDLANIAASFFLSVVAYLYTGVFLHLSYERYFWMLLALAAVAAAVVRHDAGPELVEDRASPGDPRAAIPAAAGALGRGSRGSRQAIDVGDAT